MVQMIQISRRGPQPPSSSLPTGELIQRLNLAYDWSGPDDPDNPRNFSLFTRVYCTVAVSLLAFASAFAGAVYAPAQEQVMELFQCSQEVAVLPLSLYNLGLAFGPLIGAPLSEKYGRKAVFVVSTPIFILFMVGAGFTNRMTDLVVCRFFAGMFASPNINNASATLLDYTTDRYRGITLGIYYSLPSFAATLAPLVGGFIVRTKDWRWTQWAAIIMATATYLPVLLTRETYKKVIIQRRAIRLGISDTSSQRTSFARAFRHFFTVLIQRPIHMLATEPIVTFVSLYNGLIFGLLYCFVIAVPWLAREYYHFDKIGESLSYLGVTLGTLTACCPFVLADIFFYQRRLGSWQQTHEPDEKLPPEYRLAPAMAGSVLLPISLLIAGWTAEYRIHWFVPIFFQGMTMLSSLLVYAGATMFMLDAYGPLYGASAAGAMMLTRYTLSTVFPLFTLQMFRALGAGWATSILTLMSLLMAPIPWCFWTFGERIRARSKYETSA
ncbi:major facilitator superfamily domain-containing protein [Hypoxylon fragiforme]|uniref:major facilitator superfamily domain-containing protein n=1 Tax=Hypoxylon fragiforme TaxID=63214 RepID=UPI0020C72119|nr:major facilitator superfamily domain-containing protein [Hypoxylon fragiforme]KAI2606327.1 major facilitator superfamily domain-containing protein [Hypoxylon fragiforme]